MHNSNLVRVFISSTFSDFEKERNALQYNVYPRLQDLCTQRGAKFQAVDLRWGVSDREAISQKTMKICLEELDRCQKLSLRPNFLMLIGDRYGWQPIPEEIPSEELKEIGTVISKEDLSLLQHWYKQDKNYVPSLHILRPRAENDTDNPNWDETEQKLRDILRHAIKDLGWQGSDERCLKYFASATEMEIVKGALQPVDASQHVICVMRTIQNLKNVEKTDSVKQFIDLNKETGKHDSYSNFRLSDLKERIEHKLSDRILRYNAKRSGKGLTKGHLDQMCDEVYEQISHIIISQLELKGKKGGTPNEIEMHNKYAQQQAQDYVGRAVSRQFIQKHINENLNPLVISGSSGMGKTALMAKVSEGVKTSFKDTIILRRFIGLSPLSFETNALLESIYQELKQVYSPLLNSTKENRENMDWTEWLKEIRKLITAHSEKRVVLFLDAVDQLQHSLEILKGISSITNLKVVFSITPDLFKYIKALLPDVYLYKLKEMGKKDGELLLDHWLQKSQKTLQPQQRLYLLQQFRHCPTPLYLKLAFEQARKWHSWENENKIEPSVRGIINGFLEQLENKHGEVLTSTALSLLAVSSQGLSEQEWLSLIYKNRKIIREFKERYPLSPKTSSLPFHAFSKLYFDLQPFLIESDEAALHNFIHSQFQEAVEEKYLKDKKKNRAIRKKLIEFFLNNGITDRTVFELPYLLKKNEDWEQLADLLIDEKFINQISEQGRFYSVLHEWKDLEENSWIQREEYFSTIVKNVENYQDEYLKFYVNIFFTNGFFDEALLLYDILIKRLEGSENKKELATLLLNKGMVYKTSGGDLNQALSLYEKSLEISRYIGGQKLVAACLNNQGEIYRINNPEAAQKMYKEAHAIGVDINDKELIAVTLNNRALIFHEQEELDNALPLYEEAIKIVWEIKDLDKYCTYLHNLGGLYYLKGDLDQALILFQHSLEIMSDTGLGNPFQVLERLRHIAKVYREKKQWKEALKKIEIIDHALLETENFDLYITCQFEKADFYMELRRLEDALDHQ
ncbi:tetratricopeptide repeat protein [Peribacillus simplex]|uniref:tetratricopeptide repeat protein n=1 Tax=Peribacillus simplex TaxID=1478 RepID=UPI0024C18C70|nr:tetratricopeptide repeat protein [Peribacillus simplex]WHY58636.1 tetratricopeptide repeat protein [Peribacillus simplex]